MKRFEEVLRFYKLEDVHLEKVVWKDKEFYLVPVDVLEDVIAAIFNLKFLWVSDPGTAAYIDKETDMIIKKLLTGEEE